MAQITIAGGCYVVTSKIPMADLELVRKHRPKTLTLVDEETKETLFLVTPQAVADIVEQMKKGKAFGTVDYGGGRLRFAQQGYRDGMEFDPSTKLPE
jgi:hypothetical protein